MDSTLPYDAITHWLTDYGSFMLFALLALGIVAFPVPEETLMVFAGILMANETLNIPYTVAAALGGSLCGITLSYTIGRTAGSYCIHKYGKWVGLTEERLQKAHDWFDHYGKWSLFIGYFLPGIRHFTGLIAGTTALDIRQFMLFAYAGGVVWVFTFLSFGYFFGEYAISFYEKFQRIEMKADWISIGIIGFIALVFAYLAIRHFRNKL